MKIGLVVPGFSADADDWCIPALRHLACALAATDQVRVFAVRYPYRPARYSVEGADVIAIGGAARRGLATFEVWRRTLGVLRAEHRREPFDVLHAFWATESGLLTAVAGRLLHIPTVVSLAGGELVSLPKIGYGDQRVAWERLKVATSLRLATTITAGSRRLLAIAEAHAPRSRLHYAPLGVPLDMFKPCGSAAPPWAASSATDTYASPAATLLTAASSEATTASPVVRATRFIHVGTLTPVKDQATLLRAFARLPAGARLDIVGDGPLRTSLERLAIELGIRQAVTFHGDTDHAALPDLYGQANVFVLSSLHEAQGMVALEAAACGLAVVGTCVGIMPELTDAVAPVGDAEALAKAMATNLEKSRATLIARKTFGLDLCTQRFRDLYTCLQK